MLKKLTPYLVSTAIGLYLTPYAVEAAYNARGYTAYGGEYLIIPLLWLCTYFYIHIAEFFCTRPAVVKQRLARRVRPVRPIKQKPIKRGASRKYIHDIN